MDERFGWLAFPGLIRAIALLQLVFFVMIMLQPNALSAILPDPEKAMAGEWWRLISFVFLPVVMPGPFLPIIAGLFQFLAMRILFLFNDTLEEEWGVLKTSLYVYAVIICQAVALFFYPMLFLMDFYQILFFAFATLQPLYTFLLFLVLPVQVRWLAMLAGVMIIVTCFTHPAQAIPFYLIAYLPFYFWAVPMLIRGTKNRGQVAVRRAKYERAKLPQEDTLHRCLICHRTEASDPDLQFRVAANGEEYCLDHLDDADKSPAP